MLEMCWSSKPPGASKQKCDWIRVQDKGSLNYLCFEAFQGKDVSEVQMRVTGLDVETKAALSYLCSEAFQCKDISQESCEIKCELIGRHSSFVWLVFLAIITMKGCVFCLHHSYFNMIECIFLQSCNGALNSF